MFAANYIFAARRSDSLYSGIFQSIRVGGTGGGGGGGGGGGERETLLGLAK